MSWNNVDDKHKKRYDKNFVSCDERYERDYIIQIILEEFPNLTRARVEAAVDHCCKSISAPRPRNRFWECVAAQ
jgi:hypothetical protein